VITNPGGGAVQIGTDIPPGTYKVTEVSAPAGYVISDEEQMFTVTSREELESEEKDKDGTVTKTYKTIYEASDALYFHDYKKPSLTIYKQDDTGKKLSGAYFEIYKGGTTKVGTVGPTSASGKVTWNGTDGNGLEAGIYLVKETVAPTGYILPLNPEKWIEVRIDEDNRTYSYELTFVVKVNIKMIKKRNIFMYNSYLFFRLSFQKGFLFSQSV